MYLESEISDDPRAQRAAAVAASGTNFDTVPVARPSTTLRAETSGGPRFQAQADLCASLFGATP
jgi:hypothetical protein